MLSRSTLAALLTACMLGAGSSARAGDDRELFRIDTFVGAAPVVAGESNSVIDLIDAFILGQGGFAPILGLLGVRGELDYLEIDDALRFQFSNFGQTLMVTIPSTGATEVFSGTRSEIEAQIDDWIENSGIGDWASFVQSTNALSQLAVVSGNPRSTVALMGSSPYRRFGIDDSRSRLGYSSKIERWGGVELRIDADIRDVNTRRFSKDLWTAGAEVSLAAELGSRFGISLAIFGQYRDYQGAQIADLVAEVAFPVTILRPEENASPWYWQVTPVIQAGAGGSIDLAAGGLLMGGGVVSGLGYNCERFELILANEILYYNALPVNSIRGVNFETDVSQLYFRNGVEGTWQMGAGFYGDAGIHFSNFAIDTAAVTWYTTPTIGLGWKGGRWFDVRVSYEGDLSTDSYRSHGARVKLDFMF